MYISEINDKQALRRIDITPLEQNFTPNLKWLIKLITHYDFKIRIIGGAVRDLLLGIKPRDIDLLTDATPDQLIYLLEKNHLHPYTKGMSHGTLKIKLSDGEYEITSIAFSIEDSCCPENIKVHEGGSWEEDAKRRDFTINAMSIDLDGHLYDYLNGYNDLRNQKVIFIRNPTEQIKKDPVVLLRFFHLLSMLRNPIFDKSIIPVIKKLANSVKKIKPDRIKKEIYNITQHQNKEKVLRMIKALNIPLPEMVNENMETGEP
jgi:tRNA nucleotidyltransferase (CCA-adding enzyme)